MLNYNQIIYLTFNKCFCLINASNPARYFLFNPSCRSDFFLYLSSKSHLSSCQSCGFYSFLGTAFHFSYHLDISSFLLGAPPYILQRKLESYFLSGYLTVPFLYYSTHQFSPSSDITKFLSLSWWCVSMAPCSISCPFQ